MSCEHARTLLESTGEKPSYLMLCMELHSTLPTTVEPVILPSTPLEPVVVEDHCEAAVLKLSSAREVTLQSL